MTITNLILPIAWLLSLVVVAVSLWRAQREPAWHRAWSDARLGRSPAGGATRRRAVAHRRFG